MEEKGLMKFSLILIVCSQIFLASYCLANTLESKSVKAVVGYPFSESLARIMRNSTHDEIASDGNKDLFPGRWGYINKFGAIVVNMKYHDAGDFEEGLAPVAKRKGNKLLYGYINSSEDIMIPMKFENALSFSEGVAAVKFGGKWGYIDHSGNFVIRPQYDRVKPFREGLAFVAYGDINWEVIDKKGITLLKFKSGLTQSFSEGVAAIGPSDWIGCDFKPVKSLNESSVSSYGMFSEGLINTTHPYNESINRSLFGFSDRAGRLVISGPFETTYEFSEGVAAVQSQGKWRFIDAKGNVAISRVYDDFDDQIPHPPIIFSEGLCFVKGGYIDHEGKFIIEFDPTSKMHDKIPDK